MKNLLIVIAVIAALIGSALLYTRGRSATVRVEHVFNAPINKTWRVWSDPEMMKQWWSPKHYTAPEVKNDLRVGGSFLLSMRSSDGKTTWNTGTYSEIEPFKKIVSTMSFSDQNGTVVPASFYGVPGDWPLAVTVSVEFSEFENKTRVAVTEVGIPMVMYIFAKMGWEQQFDKFDTLLLNTP